VEFIEWSGTVQTHQRRISPAWLAVAGFYGLLTLAYAWPLLGAMGSRLPSDIGDPGLNTWILWWNAHALPLTARWWNAPIFHPVTGAFALSETLLGIAWLTSPLQWLGASPVTAYNIAFLFSYFSAALAAHALAFRLTGRHSAALIAGLAYGFSPYRAAQLPHLQTLLSCWMPLALLGLHRFLDGHRRRDLLLAGTAWLLNGLTTGYFLVYFAVLAGLWFLWFVRTRRDALAIAGTLALFTLPLAPLLAGYDRYQGALGAARGLGEIVFFSADVTAIWAASAYAGFSSHWTIAPRPEGELYPGAILLGLVLVGAVAAWRAKRSSRDLKVPGSEEVRSPGPSGPGESKARRGIRRGLLYTGLVVLLVGVVSLFLGGWSISLAGLPISTNRPYKTFTTAVWLLLFAGLLHPRAWAAWRSRSPWLFYGAAAGAMFVLALGPMPHAFGEPIFYRAPYAGLMALPGGHSLRVPARFAMPMMLCLSQAAAFAVMRLSGGRLRAPLVAALALAIAIDGWVPVLKTDPVPAPVDLSGLDKSIPVLELPMADTYTETTAMLRAMRHEHPLVNGFSGYTPPHYDPLLKSLADRNPEAFRSLPEKGPLIVVVNASRDGDGKIREFVAGTPGAKLVRETDVGPVFVIGQ
jgi:hypothetical protein